MNFFGDYLMLLTALTPLCWEVFLILNFHLCRSFCNCLKYLKLRKISTRFLDVRIKQISNFILYKNISMIFRCSFQKTKEYLNLLLFVPNFCIFVFGLIMDTSEIFLLHDTLVFWFVYIALLKHSRFIPFEEWYKP